MLSPKSRALFLILSVSIAAPQLRAQQPTSDEAARMLQNIPQLLNQLRQKILTSGLTPEQVRARLRAEGYPENLLDAYLPGGPETPGSNATSPSDALSALAQLGIAD